MQHYADGQGHEDLAARLKISAAGSLSRTGSCNSRIIRTTLRDSYHNPPTLYVIGTTFMSRYELPSRLSNEDSDGRWLSYNNIGRPSVDCKFVPLYDAGDSLRYGQFWARMLYQGLPDVLIDFQYKVLSMLDSLLARGHRAVIFNTAEHSIENLKDDDRFELLKRPNIVDKLQWRSIPYQFSQGAKCVSWETDLQWDCRHVEPGQHKYLNEFLENYIMDHDLLVSS